MDRFVSTQERGVFGSRLRFSVVTADPGDSTVLKDLGTYGFIKGAPAFIIGAMSPGEKNMEDYGFAMENIILHATGLGLGTCWLGGSFDRSRFARKINISPDECVPAVAALGHKADKRRVFDSTVRLIAGSSKRKPFCDLFFERDFEHPLAPEQCGPFAVPLEMVRIGPSASNKQPWRIIRDAHPTVFHLFLQRTKNYYENNRRMFGVMDIQRIDMGIAMCHFETACRETGIAGAWAVKPPQGINLPPRTSYVATWSPTHGI
jgi:hypothetical protein